MDDYENSDGEEIDDGVPFTCAVPEIHSVEEYNELVEVS